MHNGVQLTVDLVETVHPLTFRLDLTVFHKLTPDLLVFGIWNEIYRIY